MLGDDLREALGAALPTDHARQSFAQDVLAHQLSWLATDGVAAIDAASVPAIVAAKGSASPAAPAAGIEVPASPRAPFILDVGCGRGEGLDFVLKHLPAAHWLGIDIASSAEVGERPHREDAEFRTFDGINVPVADRTVDLAFSQQVFEHVTEPEPLLADIARVLRPGGIFCGSLSQLELFHSRSVGGFTAYGWRLALERAGLHPVEVRPGVDVATLFARRLMQRSRRFDKYWVVESPVNRLINGIGRVKKLSPAERNALKLMVAGQMTFVAQRPWS